jgi:hypothetical protein
MQPAIMRRSLLLQDYLAQAASRPFAWGCSDCVAFAAGWLRLVRPDAPPLPVFERSNALQAAREIRRAAGGSGSLLEAVCSVLGEPVAPLLAHIGDLVLLPTPRERARLAQGRASRCLGHTLGICAGSAIAVLAPHGIMYTAAAWREPGKEEFSSAGVAAWRV